MLSYNEFTQKMKEEVQNRFGDGYEVLMHEVRKTNLGLTETLIILQKPEGENRISPQFYLRPMYQRYRNGTDMENLVEELICAYADSKEKAGNIMTDAGDIHDYERYRGRIYFRLINTEKNRILLEDVPHFEILDLSMVFYILISEEMDGVSSVMIQNNLLKIWELSPDDVKKQASVNTPKLFPAVVKTLGAVMKSFFAGMGQEKTKPESKDMFPNEPDADEIFILSNSKMVNGFATVLYSGELKAVSERVKKDLYVLPSSVHEALLLPADSSVSERELCKMVREINETVVSEEEVMSEQAYYYNRENDTLKMLEGDEDACVEF